MLTEYLLHNNGHHQMSYLDMDIGYRLSEYNKMHLEHQGT